jgi:hypothetical protein
MSDIIPIGKYRGQPVKTFAADRAYCDWLISQAWPFAAGLPSSSTSSPPPAPPSTKVRAIFAASGFAVLTLADIARSGGQGAPHSPAVSHDGSCT